MPYRVSIILRVAMVAICLVFFLDGKPPAISQTLIITQRNEMRDIEIARLTDFKTNQVNWNNQAAKQIQDLSIRVDNVEQEVSNIEGWEKGGFGVLTCLSILAIFFQLRKKNN